jgi:small subunit ribosomal protein S16
MEVVLKVSVKIRLQRVGARKKPFFRVVAVDSRKKRDGDVIEYLGKYHPISDTKQFEVNENRVIKWLNSGALPTGTIEKLLRKAGIWKKFKDSTITTGGTDGL